MHRLYHSIINAAFLFLLPGVSALAANNSRQCADLAHAACWVTSTDAFGNVHPFVIMFPDGQFNLTNTNSSFSGTSGLICDYLASSKLASTSTSTLVRNGNTYNVLTSLTVQPGGYADGMPTAADCTNNFGMPNSIGWYSPTENGSFYTGLYLVSQVERARRSEQKWLLTGSASDYAAWQTDAAQAQIMSNGLLKSATCTLSGSITGFISRGFAIDDGTSHYPGTSDDQICPWFMGLYAYFTSDIPSVAEKATISNVVGQVGYALANIPHPNYPWASPYDSPPGGAYQGVCRNLLPSSSGFRNSARFLFVLESITAMTGSNVTMTGTNVTTSGTASITWGQACAQALTETTYGLFIDSVHQVQAGGTTRLQYIQPGMGPEMLASYSTQYHTGSQSIAYVYVCSVLALKYLIQLDPANAATYQAGLDNTLSYMMYSTVASGLPSSFGSGVNSWNDTTYAFDTFIQSNWRTLTFGPACAEWSGSTGLGLNNAQASGGVDNSGALTTFENSTYAAPYFISGARGVDEGSYLRYPATCAAIAAIAGAGNNPTNRGYVNQFIEKYGVTGTAAYLPAYLNTYSSAIFFNEMAYFMMPSGIEFSAMTSSSTNATSAAGAAVTYSTPTATDLDYGGTVTLIYSPASSGTLSIGTHYVISGSSTSGVTGTSPFTITVNDISGVTAPTTFSANATGTYGAYVAIPAVSGSLTYGGTTPATASLTSGTFPVGSTSGTYNVVSPNNSSYQRTFPFTVSVNDLASINLPGTSGTVFASSTSTAASGLAASATWSGITANLTYGGITSNVTTSKASGSLFSGTSNVSVTTLVSCTATSPNNSKVTLTSTFTVIVLPSYTTWQVKNFTSGDLSTPAISGDLATPAGDGISNLMKYALNLPAKTNGKSGLPLVSSTTTGGNAYLTLKYTQVNTAVDLTYTPQVSSDLQTWYSGATYIGPVSSVATSSSTQSIVVQDLTPTSGTNRRFMRLMVTGP